MVEFLDVVCPCCKSIFTIECTTGIKGYSVIKEDTTKKDGK